MASTMTVFDPALRNLHDGTIDLDSDTIMVALLSNAYTFDAADEVFADLSSHEVAAGSGYSSGGATLSNKSVTYVGSAGKFTADPVTWASLTKTFRWAVIYKSGTANGRVNPLICAVLLDNTPADISVSGVDYSIQWNAAGILSFSKS